MASMIVVLWSSRLPIARSTMPAVIFGCFLCASPRPPRPHARSASFCGRNEQRHAVVGEDRPGFVPELAREMLGVLPDQLREVVAAPVRTVEAQLLAWHRSNDVSRRPATIPSAGSPHLENASRTPRLATMPNSAKWARIELIRLLRCRI
jgi:hypothetical protein